MNEDVICVPAEHIANLEDLMIKLSKEAKKDKNIEYAGYCKGVAGCCNYLLEMFKSNCEEIEEQEESTLNVEKLMRILNEVAVICKNSSDAINEKEKPFDKFFLLGEAYAFREVISFILREQEEQAIEREEGEDSDDEEIMEVYFENSETAKEE